MGEGRTPQTYGTAAIGFVELPAGVGSQTGNNHKMAKAAKEKVLNV